MQSRASILLQQQLRTVQNYSEFNLNEWKLTEDFFYWQVLMPGLRDTIWEKARFIVNVRFDENFNRAPPKINFHTIPFHPNVCPLSGRVCCDLLDNWSPEVTVLSLLLSIQCQLCCPNLKNVLNVSAAKLFRNRPIHYQNIVNQCVRRSWNVQSRSKETYDNRQRDLIRSKSYDTQRSESQQPTSRTQRSGPVKKKYLAFDDYYLNWCHLATSRDGIDRGIWSQPDRSPDSRSVSLTPLLRMSQVNQKKLNLERLQRTKQLYLQEAKQFDEQFNASHALKPNENNKSSATVKLPSVSHEEDEEEEEGVGTEGEMTQSPTYGESSPTANSSPSGGTSQLVVNRSWKKRRSRVINLSQDEQSVKTTTVAPSTPFSSPVKSNQEDNSNEDLVDDQLLKWTTTLNSGV